MPVRIILTPYDEYAAAHIPDESGRGSWCNHVIVERERTDGRTWVIEDIDDDALDMGAVIGDRPSYFTCDRCKASREAAKKPLAPPPDIEEPDKVVGVLAHRDGRAHIFKCTERDRNIAKCGLCDYVNSTRWQKRTGVMSDVTCRRCLGIVGQLVGHKRSQTKRAKRERSEDVDWKTRLDAWNAGEARAE